MKSKIKEAVKSNEVKYPCLKKWTYALDPEHYMITLFLSKGCGVTVFKSEKSNADLFLYENSYDEDEFEVFNGEVTLSN